MRFRPEHVLYGPRKENAPSRRGEVWARKTNPGDWYKGNFSEHISRDTPKVGEELSGLVLKQEYLLRIQLRISIVWGFRLGSTPPPGEVGAWWWERLGGSRLFTLSSQQASAGNIRRGKKFRLHWAGRGSSRGKVLGAESRCWQHPKATPQKQLSPSVWGERRKRGRGCERRRTGPQVPSGGFRADLERIPAPPGTWAFAHTLSGTDKSIYLFGGRDLAPAQKLKYLSLLAIQGCVTSSTRYSG